MNVFCFVTSQNKTPVCFQSLSDVTFFLIHYLYFHKSNVKHVVGMLRGKKRLRLIMAREIVLQILTLNLFSLGLRELLTFWQAQREN